MKSRKTLRALAGLLLLAGGFALVIPRTYRQKTYLIPAGGCQLETNVFAKRDGSPQGTVLLFPGLAANKKIMAFLAQGFAEQNLRVYVPDLPGHGHSPGPFSPERAEDCGAALLSGLVSRGMASPDRTIVAGHSLGGAIALRVGARIPVAGVIAISPAPMRAAHGIQPEMLLFQDPGPVPEHFLVMNGSLEPESMRGNAADLVSSAKSENAKYVVIPSATHASLLFSRVVVRTFQDWTAQTLHLTSAPGMPSRRPVYGALAGFVGLVFLAGPFLREATQKKQPSDEADARTSLAGGRMMLEFGVVAMLTVLLLRRWNPLRFLRMFEADYLVAFLLILGLAIILWHWKLFRQQLSHAKSGLPGAFFGGLILFLLFSAWLELSLYEAWLSLAKWLRFPLLFLALLPYHLAEEICLRPKVHGKGGWRLLDGLLLRLVVWGALAIGVFYLHSGEILMVLMGPYFALLFALQRRGMDIVRQETGSAAAAAVFGAILLAGFCLVIFPVT